MKHPDPSLDRYVADIRRLARVGEKEEMELLEAAQGGSLAARNRLIMAHMRFVLKVALHYRTSPLPVADLVNEGVLGLVKAIDSYEKTGIKFISYAVWWIRSTIVRAIEDRGAIIRLPANEHARLRKEKKKHGGRDGLAYAEWVRAHSAGGAGRQAWEDWRDSSPLADEQLSEKRRERRIAEQVTALPDQEAFVIRNVFGIRQEEADTLQVIAWDLGLSPERIRQIRNKALKRMREKLPDAGVVAERI